MIFAFYVITLKYEFERKLFPANVPSRQLMQML